jgi:hypothetical protein
MKVPSNDLGWKANNDEHGDNLMAQIMNYQTEPIRRPKKRPV